MENKPSTTTFEKAKNLPKAKKTKKLQNTSLENLAIVNIVWKTKENYNKRRTTILLEMLLCFTGVLGMVTVWNGFFMNLLPFFPILCLSVFVTVAITLAYNCPKPAIFVSAFAVLILVIMLMIQGSAPQLKSLIYEITRAVARSVKPAPVPQSLLYFFLCAVAVASAVVFGASLKIKNGWGLIIAALYCVANLFPVYYSYNFPDPISIILVILLLMILFVKNTFNKKINDHNLEKAFNNQEKLSRTNFNLRLASFVLILGILSFSVANIVNPATTTTFPDTIRAINSDVRSFINELLREKIVDTTALSFGQLGKIDKIVYNFKPVAQISLEEKSPVYMRMWFGDTYKASTWVSDSNNYKAFWNAQSNQSVKEKMGENIKIAAAFADPDGFASTFFSVLSKDKNFNYFENGFVQNTLGYYPIGNLENDVKAKMGIAKYLPLPTISTEKPFFFADGVPQYGVGRENMTTVSYADYNAIQYNKAQFDFSLNTVSPTYDEDFPALITALTDQYKKKAEAILNDANASDQLKADIIFEKTYGEFAKSKNTEISADTSDRTKKLAMELAGKDVFETLEKIKNHLETNTVYTLSPGITPDGNDYVDYFLFESKKGFCTHFASTAVTMLRANGYPARYVEGYRANYDDDGEGEFVPGKKYDLLDSDGHAWVEIYFDGIGWIPFETTPSFETIFSELDFASDLSDGTYKASLEPFSYDPTVVHEQSEEPQNQNGNLLIVLVGIVVFGSGIVVAIVLIITSIRRKKRISSFALADKRQAMLNMFSYILKIFLLCDIKPKKGEKLVAFAARADIAYPFAQKGDFVKVMSIFLIAKFGNEEITKEQLDFVLKFIKTSTENIYKSTSVLKKLWLYIVKAI